MADTKAKSTPLPSATKYNKEVLVNSKKYQRNRDALSVLLKDDETYTADEVAQILDGFYNKEIKEKVVK